MRAAIAGDEGAYRTLLADLSHVLRGVVRRGFAGVGIARDDVEDVVQDVLLAIHLKRHTWDAVNAARAVDAGDCAQQDDR